MDCLSSPHARPGNPLSQRTLILILALAFPGVNSVFNARGQESASALPENPFLPSAVTKDDFTAVIEHSPFRRAVGLSDSIVLTGMARIEEDLFATLVDTETREAHLVSRTANSMGWQLVGLRGDEEDLESLTAKILVAGGEVVSIRYEKLAPRSTRNGSGDHSGGGSGGSSNQLSAGQLREAREAAADYRKGFSSDGFPKEPPPEVVQKLSRMNLQQRESVNRVMLGLRNQGMGMEQRRKIYLDLLDQTLRNRR